MTPNQQAQKERARKEAEHYQAYAAVDSMRDTNVTRDSDINQKGYSADIGNYEPQSNDPIPAIKGIVDPDKLNKNHMV